MKHYQIIPANFLAEFGGSNANLYTFVTSDPEVTDVTGAAGFDVTSQATGVNFTKSFSTQQDSEPISEVSPEYKPYMEEGCQVAFVSSSTSESNLEIVKSILMDELSDYEFIIGNNATNFFLIAWGTANATKTQFYTPKLEQNSDIKNVVYWD